MALKNLGGHRTINAFVKDKTDRLRRADKTFASIFELSFAENTNVLWEESRAFRIYKTTYAEAKEKILALAPKIRSAVGSDVDCHVGLSLNNSLDWIVSFWAILAAGYSPVLVNTRLGADVLARTLEESDVKCVISAEGEHPFSQIKELPFRIIELKDLESAEEAPLPASFGADVFVMSSGTSSHVKCCAYGAEEIIAQIIDSSKIISQCKEIKKHYGGELKQLCLLPFCHIFGLTAVFLWFSFFSRTFVKLNDLSPRTVQTTVKRHKVTHIFAVPLFWEKTYEAAINGIKERGEATYGRFEKGLKISRSLDKLPALRALFAKIAFRELREEIFGESISFTITGGSTVSADVVEFFNRIGYPLADGYGMSEIGITSVELRRSVRHSKPLSVGQELASISYRRGDGGHLLVGGPSRAKYIICDGRRYEREEFFDTGDFAEYDEKTASYDIRGRSDELVIGRTGENLNPVLVENLFDDCGAEKICICATSEGGRNVATLIVSVNKFQSDEARGAVKEKIRGRLENAGLSGQIEKFVFTTSPLMGEEEFKLNRRLIAKRYMAGEFEEAAPAQKQANASGNAVMEAVRAQFASVLGKTAQDIPDDADFFTDLGGSSFDWYGMVAALSAELGISLPTAPAGISTVRAMSAAAEEIIEKTVD